MSLKARRASVVGLLLLGLLVAGALFLNPMRKSLPSASADDSDHTTSLSITSGWAVASLSDTLTTDETYVITFYHTPSGGSEVFLSEVESSKTDGWVAPNANAKLDTTVFASGDDIRARFRTYNSGGSNTFDYSRTATVP